MHYTLPFIYGKVLSNVHLHILIAVYFDFQYKPTLSRSEMLAGLNRLLVW